jgi:VanZ family protein
MKNLTDPLLVAIFRGDSGTQLFFYDNFIRWTAHYLEYFVVFLFLVWALRLRPLTALVLAMALAIADEGHQYFLPDRTCSLFDIKLDAAGAATAFILTITIGFLRGSSRFLPLSVVRDGEGSAPPQPETPPVKSSN